MIFIEESNNEMISKIQEIWYKKAPYSKVCCDMDRWSDKLRVTFTWLCNGSPITYAILIDFSTSDESIEYILNEIYRDHYLTRRNINE